MARQRNLHPGFFRDANLLSLGPYHRLLYAGLWGVADREGRLRDKALDLKIELFPADNVDVDSMLDDLERNGRIIRYEVDGERYIAIPTFPQYQHPHVREPASTIPPPPPKHRASTGPAPGQHRAGTRPAPGRHSVGRAETETETVVVVGARSSTGPESAAGAAGPPPPGGGLGKSSPGSPGNGLATLKGMDAQRIFEVLSTHRSKVLGPDVLPDPPQGRKRLAALTEALRDRPPKAELLLAAHETWVQSPKAQAQSPPAPTWMFLQDWPSLVDQELKQRLARLAT